MQVVQADVVVIGAGGAGLRAAIAAAEREPRLRVALISKLLPMRSHTVAAEGGAAGVTRAEDSLEQHFNDTVSGGRLAVRPGRGRVFRPALHPGARPARALGLSVEPQA